MLLGFLVFKCFSPDDSPVTVDKHLTIKANIYSKWSFAWLTPLLSKGSKAFITEDDLPSLASKEESEKSGDRLESALEKQ